MRRLPAIAAATAAAAALMAGPVRADSTSTYQVNDYSGGRILSILPPGENGLVNASDAAQFETNGTRPAGSQDQLSKYANLLYGEAGLTDSQLSNYYNNESFGVQPSDITRTESLSRNGEGVTIYRDTHDVPHVYGQTQASLAYGTGYVAAEDRLFLIDVLRHYGAGDLSAFLGPTCADEQMDHDELLSAAYTTAQKQQQIDNLGSYGPDGQSFRQLVQPYIDGINAYITATHTDPRLLPAEYAAVLGPPQPWSPTDVIDIASLVGGIFGKGGGGEVANEQLLNYLTKHFGAPDAQNIFADFKSQNDPDAATTLSTPFPYEIPGTTDSSKIAHLDDPSAPLQGGPTGTTSNCNLNQPSPPAVAAAHIVQSFLLLRHGMSNALLIDAAHSADGHPIAVFGPQVSYYAPQILMEEDLHAPDYDEEGASFPGTNLIVELGRGQDYAWSATSASSDNVDERAEQICDPAGGTPQPQGTYYLFRGQCVPMVHTTFSETCYPTPAGQGAPVVINHDIYTTQHGIVQGWTTADGGKPVAIVVQRSTFNHEIDSGVGFYRWGRPSETFDAQSWMVGASQIQYTFNWFYVDSSDIAYYQSGLDPIRPADVDPNQVSWGTGVAEWQGFLGVDEHPHQIGSATGFLDNWNNKPAPQFSAADNNWGYGPVYRSMSLTDYIQRELAANGGKLTRANLVQAMEQGASVDLSGRRVLPELLPLLQGRSEPAGVAAMLASLQTWLDDGAWRKKAQAGDAQYAHADAVAIMDDLYPRLQSALFDPLFAGGGQYSHDGLPEGYNDVPIPFANTPEGDGAHLGSAYDGGWEGYDVKALRQLRGESVGQPFSAATASRLCGDGTLATCETVLDAALQATYDALVKANGGSTDVTAWTQSTQTATAGVTMPQWDEIHYTAVGLVGQPAMDWQNRPTFQQVAEFTSHRSGTGGGQVPEAPWAPLLPAAAVAIIGVAGWRRRRGS